jgi:simple sugar transport system permease protein
VFWGDPELQGLHVGLFVALAAGVVFWVILNRSAKGYEARRVGFNPDAAAYGGINVGRTYFTVMATCGVFAGPGRRDRRPRLAVPRGHERHRGLAVRLPRHRGGAARPQHRARDGLAALLFGALLQGTSVRNLDPTVFDPQLAGNLTTIIQGLVVLVVSADVLVTYFYRLRRRRKDPPVVPAQAGGSVAAS